LTTTAFAVKLEVPATSKRTNDSGHYTLLGTFDWFAVGMAVALARAVIEHTGNVPAVVRALWRRPSLCGGRRSRR